MYLLGELALIALNLTTPHLPIDAAIVAAYLVRPFGVGVLVKDGPDVRDKLVDAAERLHDHLEKERR
jgi:hypothetical protein